MHKQIEPAAPALITGDIRDDNLSLIQIANIIDLEANENSNYMEEYGAQLESVAH